MSVPHTAAAWTLTRRSSSPNFGIGRSVSVAPRTGFSLINAFIVLLLVVLPVHVFLHVRFVLLHGQCPSKSLRPRETRRAGPNTLLQNSCHPGCSKGPRRKPPHRVPGRCAFFSILINQQNSTRAASGCRKRK